MSALLRYQLALLGRSQKWLAPVLLYAAFLAIGIQGGQPVLDSLGYGSAILLPVAAWLTRVCVTNEPPAARACVAAATGPGRAHLAALLTAFGCTAALGALGTGLVLAISKWADTENTVRIDPVAAGAAGLLAAAVCALLGTAVGALGTWPLLRGTGWGVTLTALGALLALVTAGSPARSAVTGLVTGSHTGTVDLPYSALVGALLLAGAAGAVVCALSARRA
ncbi:ABC transporter [Streptomyces sp. NPDC004111]|uniref:ABC transporter n=1 Tax=Streptomyces sp. NPDC004111 TaxID=3364690 RepID=UPI00367E802C